MVAAGAFDCNVSQKITARLFVESLHIVAWWGVRENGTPWGDGGVYPEIARRFWRGASFKVTPISEQFGWEQLRAQNPNALFLCWVHGERFGLIAADTTPPVGSKVVFQSDGTEAAAAPSP